MMDGHPVTYESKGRIMKRDRREFLADVGRGMLVASVGSTIALDLGLSSAYAFEGGEALTFGDMEPLVSMMQETPIDKLQATVVAKHKSGVDLKALSAAAALANARSFGGQDYDGYHTFMAIGPAFEMARELPDEQKLLPMLKVFYRNTNRIQQHGGRANEVLHKIQVAEKEGKRPDGEMLRQATRDADFDHAEELFAALAEAPPNEAYNHLQFAIQDEVDVHRTVLAWRAWMMLDITGKEHANTLLRQSVRFCVDSEAYRIKNNRPVSGIRELLPQLLSNNGLLDKTLGERELSDSALNDLVQTIFAGSRDQAASAVAMALAEGISTESIGEAMSLAANQLLLWDPGRSEAQASPGKPAGSVHGASVGVHAMDSANAWRNIARVSNHRNCVASLIVGAYHTAGQRGHVGQEVFGFESEAESLTGLESKQILEKLDIAVRQGNQKLASGAVAAAQRINVPPFAVFQTLLNFAVSEDGALHAEKFYRTVTEEFSKCRQSKRWSHLIALARVSASEYGNPAPGQAEARELLGLST
jgi:hypothetical protein